MDKTIIIALISTLSIAAVWDLRIRKIPNLLTYPMMLLGMIIHGVDRGLDGLAFSGLGMIVGIGIFLIPYLLGGMGAGDAKLMGGVGAILGTTGVIIAAVISILLGLVYAIILLIVYRKYGSSFLKRSWNAIRTFIFTRQWIYVPADLNEKQPVLSYALPIALGTFCTVFFMAGGSNLLQQLLGVQFNI